jgi:hypothetical protein
MILLLLQYLAKGFHWLVNHSWARIGVEILSLVLAVWLGFAIHRHYVPSYTTVQTNEHTTTVSVEKPVLTEKLVTKIISDPKDKAIIAAQLAEINRLKLDATSLSETIAQLKEHGSGQIVAEAPAQPGGPTNYHFKDYRLDFRTDLTTAQYDLSQKFIVLATQGKDAHGQRTTLVSVYEEGPHGERILIPAQTTTVVANESVARWFAHVNVQAGAAFTKSDTGATVNGGLIGVQWLKHGTTLAPADTKWAVLTPTYFVSQNVKEFGVLPVSFNLGVVPHQPFTNIWFSPYLGMDIAGRGISRLGFAITATF